MNLASFYLCLFMNINTLAKLFWNAISWEKKTTILVALYTHHFRKRFNFVCFFFLASLFLGNLRQEAQVFVHTRPLRVNMIAGKDVGVFLFY